MKPYNDGCKEVNEALKKMEPYLTKHPTMNRILKEEAVPTIEEIKRFDEAQIAAVKSCRLEEARMNIGGGKELFDRYRGIHKKIDDDVDVTTKRDWTIYQ